MQVWIISYHYPPSNAAGGSRVYSFVQFLTQKQSFESGENQLGVCVGTKVVSSTIRESDESKANGYAIIRVPSGIDSFDSSLESVGREKQPTQEPISKPLLSHSKTWLKSVAKAVLKPILDLKAYPDKYHSWSQAVYHALDNQLRNVSEHVILLSSGPPHSTHLAAQKLKKQHNFSWVMDMRDPWIGNPFRGGFSQPAEYLDRLAERRCFSDADAIVVNTLPALDLLRKRFGSMVDDKSYCIPNGYEEHEFKELASKPLWSTVQRPVMLYTGSLYGPRSGAGLLDALRSLKRKGIQIPRLVLLGSQDKSSERTLVEKMGGTDLLEDVEILPSVERRQALNAMMAADALILIGDNRPDQLQVPSKLFEYLRIGKPILALYPINSPVIKYLQEYSVAFLQAAPDNPAAISLAITSLVDELSIPVITRAPKRPVMELSREHQNRKLWSVVEKLKSCNKLSAT